MKRWHVAFTTEQILVLWDGGEPTEEKAKVCAYEIERLYKETKGNVDCTADTTLQKE